MDFKQMYQEKLVSAEKAASVIKSGDWVDYGWTTATPIAVDKEIAKRLPELTDVNFRGGILMWVPEIFKIENRDREKSDRTGLLLLRSAPLLRASEILQRIPEQAGCRCLPGFPDGRARFLQLRTERIPYGCCLRDLQGRYRGSK